MEQTQEPRLALLRSLVVPGLGQYYNGDSKKAAAIFLSAFLLAASTTITFLRWQQLMNSGDYFEGVDPVFLLPAVFLLALWIFNVFDAHLEACKKNGSKTNKLVYYAGLGILTAAIGLPTLSLMSMISLVSLTAPALILFGIVLAALVRLGGITESGISKKIFLFFTALVIISTLWGGLMLVGLSSPGSSQNERAVSYMRSDLKSIYASGFGVSSPKKITFYVGEISQKDILGKFSDIPLNPTELSIRCSLEDLCNRPQSPLQLTTDSRSLVIDKTTQAYVVACGDDSRKENPKYCVGIARQPNEAIAACKQGCGMTLKKE